MAQKVLRYTQNEAAAKAEVERHGGRFIHQFSPTAFVAELPNGFDPVGLTASTAQPTQPLDAATQLAVDAWAAGRAKTAQAAPTTGEGLPWDTPGFDPPLEFGTPAATPRLAAAPGEVSESTGTPTSLYMIGSVAVGLVLVSRDTGTEVLTDEERTKIVQEVQEGLDWLTTVEPRARVSFVYDIRMVTVSSAPGPYSGVTDQYERFERGWRDAALASLGYAPGRPGYQQYANDLRANRHTNWAYVVFFTKYQLNHFAYAVAEKVVMNYNNDGWGPDNINRVFAHESCHIFGAADEYGSCSCGGSHGHLGIPNNNCINCFPPGAQVPCLMNANTLMMCDFSRRQIGWWFGVMVRDATIQQLAQYFPQTDDHHFHVASHRWAGDRGFTGGVPCHEQSGDLRGIICIRPGTAEVMDATVQELAQHFPQTNIHNFHVAAHRWARDRGFAAGVPCHEQSGNLRGIICFRTEFVVVQDATVQELSQHFPQDGFHHFHVAAHRWARDRGFEAGIPCHEQSGDLRGIICIR